MSQTGISRPTTDEYHPFYETYVRRIGAGPILVILESQSQVLRDLPSRLRQGGEDYRYAPDKWSIKEILGHLSDTERIVGCRATCIARGETAELPGFDENDYVAAGEFGSRQVDSLIREFEYLRAANVEMLQNLVPAAWSRVGTANGSPVSVRALGWILAGHVDHHLAVLGDRYAKALSS